MKILITAGSTKMPIDKVRCVTNIFKGTTGAWLAVDFCEMEHQGDNHEVTILANDNIKSLFSRITDDEHMCELTSPMSKEDESLSYLEIYSYKTYDDLRDTMETLITENDYDVIIHSAAVSDYRVVDVMVGSGTLGLHSVMKGKVKSNHDEIYIKMAKTEKLVDKIRKDWGFKGKLVKFKLEVDITDDELLSIAKKSRKDSEADIIVANTLANFSSTSEMFVIDSNDAVYKITREGLSGSLRKLL